MDRSSTTGPEEVADLVVDVVETVEAYGVDRDEYRLYDVVDPEALGRIISSSGGDAEVRFTVKGIRLAVTANGVEVLTTDQPSSP